MRSRLEQAPSAALCGLHKEQTRISKDEEKLFFALLWHSGIAMGEIVPFALTNTDFHTENYSETFPPLY